MSILNFSGLLKQFCNKSHPLPLLILFI